MKGSPDRSVSIADLAGAGTIHGKGSGEVPEAPTGDTGGCVGRLGNETFLAPQLITQAAHVKVDRETGVVRVLKVAAAHDSGVILNRMGADGQVTGGVVMGVGLALSEGTSSMTRADSGTRTCSTTSSSRAPTPRRSRSTGCRSRPRVRARAAPRAWASRRRCPPRARSRTRSPRWWERRSDSCR